MKRLAILILPLVLAGCDDPTDEQRAHVQSGLPAGCELHDLGSYGSISHLVVVTCGERSTQTTNWREHHQCGKTPCDRQGVTVFTRNS